MFRKEKIYFRINGEEVVTMTANRGKAPMLARQYREFFESLEELRPTGKHCEVKIGI